MNRPNNRSSRQLSWIDFTTIRAVGGDEVEQLRAATSLSLEARLTAVQHLLPRAVSADRKNLEPVHDLRVSTRRAIAALSLYEELLPQDLSKRMCKTMNSIRRAAGDARDLDVLMKRLKADRFKKKKQLVQLLRKRRARAQRPIRKLHRRLMEKNQLQKRSQELLENISVTESVSLIEWASERLWTVVEDLELWSRRIQVDKSHLHSFRIAVKQFRYRIELLADLFDEDIQSTTYPLVCAMQDRLGEINDHFAAAKQFRSLRKWSIEQDHPKLERRLREWQQTEQRFGKELARDFMESYDSVWIVSVRESLATALTPQQEVPREHSC